MMQSVTYDVDTRQISYRRENCVRTIEQSNLSLMIRSLRLSNQHMQASLVSREFLTQLFTRHILWSLDYPQVEYLSLNNEVVLIANLLLYLSDVLTWESRNNTVNKSSTNIVILLKPLLEALIVSSEVILPKLDILAYAVLQMVTIEEDKLTRHDDETL